MLDSTIHQAPVVQTLDIAILRIITIQRISITEINYAIRWIVIYPVDSVIRCLNNLGQMNRYPEDKYTKN